VSVRVSMRVFSGVYVCMCVFSGGRLMRIYVFMRIPVCFVDERHVCIRVFCRKSYVRVFSIYARACFS